MPLDLTPSQTIGPFFHFALTPDAGTGCMAGPEVAGERIRLACRVWDGEQAPVTDAMIELWQADIGGFGRLATDEHGVCVFESVRSPHVNVSIFARGLVDRLVTRIYFAGDPRNLCDPGLALVPADRRHTLLAHADAAQPGLWHFEIHLRGEGETVFFDL